MVRVVAKIIYPAAFGGLNAALKGAPQVCGEIGSQWLKTVTNAFSIHVKMLSKKESLVRKLLFHERPLSLNWGKYSKVIQSYGSFSLLNIGLRLPAKILAEGIQNHILSLLTFSVSLYA